MSDEPQYFPPRVWTWDKESGGEFASINRPIAGPTHDKVLPVGKHPLQLYSLTCNAIRRAARCWVAGCPPRWWAVVG